MMSARRVILRVHEKWLDDYMIISNAWITSYGWKDAASCSWEARLAHISTERFHIVIDLEDNPNLEPVDVESVAIDVYRVRRGSDGTKM
jgi:hypothetical protein